MTSLAVDSPPAVAYVSAARPNGVVGGAAARALSTAIVDALRARSDVAEPDGALAEAAAWFVAADGESRKRGAGIAARRSGFVGEVLTAAVFPIGEPEHWRRALAALARNFPVTRYGVYVSPDGRVAGVVFGDVALKLEPFPRHVHAGQTLRLRGEVEPSVRSRVGACHRRRRPGQSDALSGAAGSRPTCGSRSRGLYRVEVMGDGAIGPTVLANVPIYVDVAEPDLDRRSLAKRRRSARSAGRAGATCSRC